MHSPPTLPDPQAMEDASHLRMLSIAHYIFGGITGLFACIPLIHVAMGVMMISGKLPMGPPPSASSGTPPPDMQMFGWFFVGIGGAIILLGWALAAAMVLTGRWLSARKHPTFCFVVACIECINMPLGTLLGVFTIIVLQRPSVRGLFLDGPGRNNFTHT